MIIEKTMFMYTKYTSLHYFNYLTYCVSYTRSYNCIGFPIVGCTVSQSFIDTLYLDNKLKSKKVVKTLCAHKQSYQSFSLPILNISTKYLHAMGHYTTKNFTNFRYKMCKMGSYTHPIFQLQSYVTQLVFDLQL